MNPHDWIIPDWPAPSWIKAVSTTRVGGVSAGVYASLNLAEHVADDPLAVLENRRRLREQLALPTEPVWLQQVHGCGIVDADATAPLTEGDGATSRTPGHVCVVMTADCLPVLLCDRVGTRVAAVHAGWRGLATGVIEAAVAALGVPGNSVLAWLGPAIGPQAFEVGADVRAAFVAHNPAAADAFTAQGERWQADLYRLAHQRLAAAGITEIYGGGLCTCTDAARFYSYRREGVTGRMASLIWSENP